MAEDAAKTPGGSKLISTMVIVGVMIFVPAILALLLYLFVLRPMLAAPAPEEEVIAGAFPATMTMVNFPEERATVRTQDPNEAAPILIYQVAMACNSPETAEVVNANMAWFQAKFLELHSNRTRNEVNDPYVKQTILRLAKQEANALLQRLAPGPEREILEVMHLKFSMFDL